MRLLLVAMLLLSSRPARAAGGAEVFDFLELDASARAVALGGAYTALASDAHALRYNPGGLGALSSHEAAFMHNSHVEGASQDYLALALKSGFGFQANYSSLGSVQRTTLSQPGGTGSSFGAYDLALGAGYGRALAANLGVGAGLKYYRGVLDDVSADGVGADVGALYHEGRLRLGASLLNFGPDVKYQHAKEKLPMSLRAGAAYSLPIGRVRNALAVDLSKTRLDKVRVGLGVESCPMDALAVRVGFTTRNDAGLGLTAGVGFAVEGWTIDYAIVPMDELGLSHRVGLALRWGGEGSGRARALPREPARMTDPFWPKAGSTGPSVVKSAP